MATWLITTPGWPVLTAHLGGTTARLVVDPVVAGAVAGATLALGGGTLLALLRARVRRTGSHGRST